jgi:hypothetical protein
VTTNSKNIDQIKKRIIKNIETQSIPQTFTGTIKYSKRNKFREDSLFPLGYEIYDLSIHWKEQFPNFETPPIAHVIGITSIQPYCALVVFTVHDLVVARQFKKGVREFNLIIGDTLSIYSNRFPQWSMMMRRFRSHKQDQSATLKLRKSALIGRLHGEIWHNRQNFEDEDECE